MRAPIALAALALAACSDSGGPAVGFWTIDGNWSCSQVPSGATCEPPAYFPAIVREIAIGEGGRVTWGGQVIHDGDVAGKCISVGARTERGHQLVMAEVCTGTVNGVDDPTKAGAQIVWRQAAGQECWCGGFFDFLGAE